MVQNNINIVRLGFNKSINQGFINSNITTPQTIQSLNTNTIAYNGYNIDNVFSTKSWRFFIWFNSNQQYFC